MTTEPIVQQHWRLHLHGDGDVTVWARDLSGGEFALAGVWAMPLSEQNARIIAAAPKMLAALEQLDTAYETGGEGDFAAAKAAIAKARGEQS